ncbi:MAG: TRAP transporter substrate-binding protein DctP [Deltaproteobacteria bacterium]|nr:TRAP transporter substrate-binding protein DctP [Deltaproteobacteria bacterium]
MKKSLLILGLVCALGLSARAQAKTVKLGTLAPTGSPWHKALLDMAQQWSAASAGTVELKIYPDGRVGNETDMVRKMRIGQLQAAMITGIGLGEISRLPLMLQVPMLFESWEQLDCVRDMVGPKIEQSISERGFVVLNWGDAGWVYQFSKAPAKTANDYRKLKYFVWAGDAESEKAWRTAQFNVVPLSSTDVLAALQTDMVNAFGTSAIYALSSQWFGLAKHMVKINWVALNGATVVDKKVWEGIDAELRAKLLDISRVKGAELRKTIREMSDKAVTAMVEHGLVVHEPSPAEIEEWREAAKLGYPVVRGEVVPAESFDEVLSLAAKCKK